MKKRRKSPNLPPSKPLLLKGALSPMRARPAAPFIKRCSLSIRARPFHLRVLSLHEGAPLLLKGALHNLPAPFHLSKPSPTYLPATSADSPPPPYQGHGGTTNPSTPFDMESSIAASWPREGLLTTSQAVTMNPRSQWSLFEFGNRLNCEEICIQKFSCSSGGRGHFVLACLMGCL